MLESPVTTQTVSCPVVGPTTGVIRLGTFDEVGRPVLTQFSLLVAVDPVSLKQRSFPAAPCRNGYRRGQVTTPTA